MGKVENILERFNQRHIWDSEPVFCFTSDIDWASESVMQEYFNLINPCEINPTLFCTHESKVISECYFDKGIHPNFLPRSSQSRKEMNLFSHRDYYRDIIETCKSIVPGTKVFRTHRSFDVTDTNHLLKEEYGFEYCSNQITIMQTGIKPVLMESGLINFPVFFEDGTHLYNKLDLDFRTYANQFTQPGIKIISFHPMNFVLNSPSYGWMRNIKDNMTYDEYQHIIHPEEIERFFPRENKKGIQNTILDIIEFAKKNYRIYSLKQLYEMI